ncbi:hypothetical protein [Paenibacillus sp. NPDC055715]
MSEYFTYIEEQVGTAEKENPDDTSPIALTFFGGDASSNWNNMKLAESYVQRKTAG